MRRKFAGNYVKVAVIAVSIALASACALAGTFAAFSATYTWTSQSGEAGDVAYRDTAFSLDLFGDGYILPGDEGSAELGGVDLDGADVAWRFEIGTAEDDRVIPVVFYVSEDGSPVPDTYYSAYNFSEHGGYLSVGGNYIPASSVSTDATGITAALGTGKSVCWTWPDSVYADQSGTVDEVALADYQAYCAEVCDVGYAYTAETYGDIFKVTYPDGEDTQGTVTPVATVTGESEGGLTVKGCDVNTDKDRSGFVISDGILLFNGEAGYVEIAGRFEMLSSSASLTRNSRVWLLVPTSQMTDDIKAALSALGAEVAGTYGTSDNKVFIPDQEGTRTLVKLPPVQTRASVSVTVSAVVTF